MSRPRDLRARGPHLRESFPGPVGFGGVVLCLLALLAGDAVAEPLSPKDVPEPLRPWIGWVLRDAPEAFCPYAVADASSARTPKARESDRSQARPCLWISELEVIAEERGAVFRQRVSAFSESWASLPGDPGLWPEEVQLDGKPVAVVERPQPGGGVSLPSVWVASGPHRIVGRFRWDRIPEALSIPAQTGLARLQLNGAQAGVPARPRPDQIRFGLEPATPKEADRLEVSVHRKLADGVPSLLETRLRLSISGARRELVFEGYLPDGFALLGVDSELPARVDGEGRLRIEGRAGRFEVRIRARSAARQLVATYPEVVGPWDPGEIWSFEDAPDLRWVDVEGVPAVDPQQTELPGEWRTLPSYLLEAGATLRLVERRRAGEEPTPDRLALERTIWLDFSGDGYTIQDRVSGTLGRSDRLEMRPEIDLGRVAIDGVDRPITRLEPGSAEGVELRTGSLNLDADARLERRSPDTTRPPAPTDAANARSSVRATPAASSLSPGSIPTVGWSADFTSAQAELRLPPGWTALHVSGPDRVTGSWIDGWSLLELFLVLITALAIGQLTGHVWGASALIALVLTFPERGAPQTIWLLAIGAQALVRIVPIGRLSRAVQIARLGVALGIAATALPFAVQQAQQALYPALEPHSGDVDPYRGGGRPVMSEVPQTAPATLDSLAVPPASPEADSSAPRKRIGFFEPIDADAVDPDALASTGMGVPDWNWRSVRLQWTGPTTREESFHPILLPPVVNRFLALLRVAGIVLLVALSIAGTGALRSLRDRIQRTPSGGDEGPSAPIGLWLLALGGSLGLSALPAPAAADFPPREQLDELRQRLTEPPSCLPRCATLSRLRLDVDSEQLMARLELDVAATTAVALPGSLTSFVPERVTVDSNGSPVLMRDAEGTLLIQLDAGRHRVLLVGSLPQVEVVDLPLPLAPKQIEVASTGWSVSGVRGDGRATNSVKLVRARPATADSAGSGEPARGDADGAIASRGIQPFVRVTRVLRLGISWEIQTQVERLSPLGQPLVLRVPLLAGESVTDRSVEIREGQVEVSLESLRGSAGWTSTLQPASPIILEAPALGTGERPAPEGANRVETWTLMASPLWHVEASGIPATGNSQSSLRTWIPWPGEKLTLEITRPEPSPGQSVTIDQSKLRISPGARASEDELQLRMRASRAERHAITLPEGSELIDVRIDDVPKPLRPVEGVLEIPLHPGPQTIGVRWRRPAERSLAHETVGVDLGMPSVNHTLTLAVPRDRWILAVGGPLLGPAVRFWGMLAVAALLAVALGRMSITPLGPGSWFLLFVGLTQTDLAASALIVAWLLALGLRGRKAPERALLFNVAQLGLALLGLLALSSLVAAISTGLLGSPEMQIVGNGSSGRALIWYQDRTGPVPDSGWVLWVPIWVYRAAMLAWALWIAQALLKWLRWGWECMSRDGLWRPLKTEASGD